MYQIHFVNQKTVHASAGGLLSKVCADAGFPLNLVCGGTGRCGKCQVEVQRPGGERETVLACKAQVDSDLSVYLSEGQLSHAGAAIMTEGVHLQQSVLRPAVTRRCLTRQELAPEHCGAYLNRCALPVLRRFSALIADTAVRQITMTYHREELIAVQPGDTTGQLYGGAVDIGTTTVALYLYNLTTGDAVYTGSALNRQIACGADVISRILHAFQDPAGLDELHSQVLEGINTLLAEAESACPGLRENLYHMVLCGNSTMQHLFLGMNPSGLAVDPFVNVTADLARCTGAEAGLDMAPGGVVEFLPLLGGFVGADTTAVLLTLPEEAENCLMIDLGTNGEIAAGGSSGYQVASTACGPALEGGNIACGMRGTAGAIERISLAEDQVRLQVIGGGAPRGLCGSAIIDAVAELLRVGVLDESGLLCSQEEYAKRHPGSALAACLGPTEDSGNAFFFTRGEHPVYLSQQDVRQIQLAKSAIYAGCITLLTEAGLEPQQVTNLYLAGAFGNYINVDNALYIGLLPPVLRERIHSIGNGAGQGAKLCLLDRSHLERCEALPGQTRHVELAANPLFMEEYILNMNFSPRAE